jgi:hypothetical protein
MSARSLDSADVRLGRSWSEEARCAGSAAGDYRENISQPGTSQAFAYCGNVVLGRPSSTDYWPRPPSVPPFYRSAATVAGAIGHGPAQSSIAALESRMAADKPRLGLLRHKACGACGISLTVASGSPGGDWGEWLSREPDTLRARVEIRDAC